MGTLPGYEGFIGRLKPHGAAVKARLVGVMVYNLRVMTGLIIQQNHTGRIAPEGGFVNTWV